MTIDTAIAESEAGMDDLLRFQTVEDMVIHHHPEWQYLVNATLDVRPPTEAEARRYAARYDDGTWADMYAPVEPRVILPPSDEVAALLDPPAEVPGPDPDPLPPPVLDEDTEKALTKFLGIHEANPVRDDPALAPEPEDALEVHHDTRILYVPPAEA
jgi:hypothetical protein